jgi:hypothetical protein
MWGAINDRPHTAQLPVHFAKLFNQTHTAKNFGSSFFMNKFVYLQSQFSVN